MDPMQIGVFDLAEKRLAWTEKRQGLLAQNIANANTPGFKPHDLKPFAATLSQVTAVAPLRTHPNHIGDTANTGAQPAETIGRQDLRSPDGNAVALDVQLAKIADTATTQSLVTTIYKKYMSLFGLALGRGVSS